MKTNVTGSGSFVFYLPTVDALLLVENEPEAVVIRAARNALSIAEMERFVRRLAAEGFIPDDFQWFCWGDKRVRWLVDRSWIMLDPEMLAETNRWMVRILASAGIAWLTLMVGLFMFYGPR